MFDVVTSKNLWTEQGVCIPVNAKARSGSCDHDWMMTTLFSVVPDLFICLFSFVCWLGFFLVDLHFQRCFIITSAISGFEMPKKVTT